MEHLFRHQICLLAAEAAHVAGTLLDLVALDDLPHAHQNSSKKFIATSNKGIAISNEKLLVAKGALLGARTLLGAPGLTTRSKKLLVAKGIATRSKDAARGSWPYY